MLFGNKSSGDKKLFEWGENFAKLANRIILPAENVFEFRGAKMNYRVMGEGRPVVLLHGSMVADPWDGWERLLSAHFKVYLPDLPGFGASEAVEGQLHDTDMFCAALGEFLEKTRLWDAPVIAFSLGTVVAIKAAEAGVAKGKLVLVGMPVSLESKLLGRIMDMSISARRALAVNEVARGGILLAILKDVIGMADRDFTLKYLQKLRTTDVRAMVDSDVLSDVQKDLPWILPGVRNETHYVYGEHDKLRQGAIKRIKSKIHVVKGAGHDVFVSRPEETLKLIIQLLKPGNTIWKFVRDSIFAWR